MKTAGKSWREFDFNDLFVLDLANNHQGSVEHGTNVIRAMGEVINAHRVRAAVKFQFRQLDTFIHPAFRDSTDNKHIPRFLSTELKPAQFGELLTEVRKQDMLAMCTPFDEESVDIIVDMGFDILKIASCSAGDWPLLEKAASANLPIVVSTGGLTLDALDELSSFFFHRGANFAMMHCVSIYPTPANQLELSQIEAMRQRYPYCTIGWSTHEEPDNYGAVQVALAKGAKIFERHVGLPTDTITLNGYSSTPEQVDKWVASYKQAKAMCGGDVRPPVSEDERLSILSLQRGVYARKGIKAGSPLARENVFFAMPCQEGQLSSGEWKPSMVAAVDIDANGEVSLNSIEKPAMTEGIEIKHAIHKVKALLNEARVPLNSDFEVEFSHHYGMENFNTVGAVLINCINRSYCKKVLVQLPGQHHPLHFHKEKEETFQVLYGTLEVEIDRHRKTLRPGETCLVQPGVWHEFWTETGCVFEEISTRDVPNDSVYAERRINSMGRSERKTVVDHWGRFQLGDGSLSWV